MFVRLFSAVSLFILLIAGCSRPAAEQQGEVSGKVTYKGKPLPGGKVTFVSPKGYNSTSVISPRGEYQLKASLGEVWIGVDNRMLNKNDPKLQEVKANRRKNRLKPKGDLADKQQPAEGKQGVTGAYVPLPSCYAEPTISGLTYTVNPGSQTHDIELSDNPAPAPPSPR